MTNLPGFPQILGVRDQARVVNAMLAKRFETILPAVMRETGFDMWLTICNEDNYDPIFHTISPWEVWAPILQMVVFYDRGNRIERLNISRTDMQGLMTDIWNDNDQWDNLKRIVEERNPRRIGINTSAIIWAADGLTASLKDKLIETLGPDLSARLQSAESLCIRWLETRTPDEIEMYHQACAIGHTIIDRCFSRETITPGVTAIDDMRWHYWQMVTDLGLQVSFPPFFRLMRSNTMVERWGKDDRIIRHGDMIHCDVGVKYLRLITDHQELAYVLHPGETQPPAGLLDAMKQGNQLQDIFTQTWALGLTGNEILASALKRARDEGLSRPKIYSHSLSFFLHEPGPLMGLPWEQVECPGRGDVHMYYNTAYTVELSVTCPIPEWGDQEVSFPLEQDAVFLESGVTYVDGRQTQFHLL